MISAIDNHVQTELAIAVLTECANLEPLDVLVVAIRPQQILIRTSGGFDRLKILGALEALKMEIWVGDEM